MVSTFAIGDGTGSVEDRYATVRRLSIWALATHGITVRPGFSDVPGDDYLIGSDGFEYRLYNLQLQCAQLAPHEWEVAVVRHIANGIQARNAPPAATQSTDEFLARIRTRLNPAQPTAMLPMEYVRPAFDGLVVDLNRDLPTAVETVSDYHVVGRDLDLLYEVGQRNTDAEPMDVERLDHEVVAVMGESFFIASKALNMQALIDSVFGGVAPWGVVFSVPHRSLLFLHAVGPQVLNALQWIVPVTIGQAGEAPGGPISAETYYWHNGKVQRITQRDPEANTIGLLIDGAFAEAVGRVAAQQQG